MQKELVMNNTVHNVFLRLAVDSKDRKENKQPRAVEKVGDYLEKLYAYNLAGPQMGRTLGY